MKNKIITFLPFIFYFPFYDAQKLSFTDKNFEKSVPSPKRKSKRIQSRRAEIYFC